MTNTELQATVTHLDNAMRETRRAILSLNAEEHSTEIKELREIKARLDALAEKFDVLSRS